MRKLAFVGAATASLILAGCNQSTAADSPGGDALTQLADRIAIEDMIVSYYEQLSQNSHAELANYFTDDAVMDVNGEVVRGKEGIVGIYGPQGGDQEQPAAAPTPAEPEPVSHMLLSNPVIDVEGDTATAKFIWTQIRNDDINGPPSFVEQGREYDLLVKQDGKWLIKKRTIIADSGMPAARFGDTYQPRLDYDITAE